LEDIGTRIPKIIVDGTENEVPYVILNFIPGKDLGDVYTSLTKDQKQEIVKGLVRAQKSVEEQLPSHCGYGYLSSYEDQSYKKGWKEVILSHLERSRKRIRENKVFDSELVDRVENELKRFDEYFAHIEPLPFLEDTSTKNVLIHE